MQEVAELENTIAVTKRLLDEDHCREQVAVLEARLVEVCNWFQSLTCRTDIVLIAVLVAVIT